MSYYIYTDENEEVFLLRERDNAKVFYIFNSENYENGQQLPITNSLLNKYTKLSEDVSQDIIQNINAKHLNNGTINKINQALANINYFDSSKGKYSPIFLPEIENHTLFYEKKIIDLNRVKLVEFEGNTLLYFSEKEKVSFYPSVELETVLTNYFKERNLTEKRSF